MINTQLEEINRYMDDIENGIIIYQQSEYFELVQLYERLNVHHIMTKKDIKAITNCLEYIENRLNKIEVGIDTIELDVGKSIKKQIKEYILFFLIIVIPIIISYNVIL